MRIRILQPRTARIDGVDLSVFRTGHVYEVDPSIATYLIVSGVAEPSPDDSPALVVRTKEVMVSVFRGSAMVASEVADDSDDDDDGPGAA